MDDPAGIDLVALTRWFADSGTPVTGPLAADRVSGGHSNITFRLEDACGRAFVLRRPPDGDLPPGAHDVVREARIMRSLAGSRVPVPAVVGSCSDVAVLGAPFYVMEWASGDVVAAPHDVRRVLPTDTLRRAAAESLVDVLAELHAVDATAAGLQELNRPGDHIERQLGRMWQVWERTRTRELPQLEELHGRLLRRRPPQRHTGLVHGDYRLGNVMVGPAGRIVAVLDWELAAIGDVLCDLAFLINNWESPDESAESAWMQEPPTRAGGFPPRSALIERYASRTGFDVSGLAYYRAFTYWRMAIIAEGIKRRYESGSMTAANGQAAPPGGRSEVDFAHLERRVRVLAALADRHLQATGS